MTFQYLWPWWAVVLVLAIAGLLAIGAYARPLVPLASGPRAALVALRFLTLTVLIAVLLGPVTVTPAGGLRDAVVPILIDASRSMRLGDVDGVRRIDRAVELVRAHVLPALQHEFRTEVLTFGEDLQTAALDAIAADARHTNVAGALRAVRDRYDGETVAGILLLTDGAETGREAGAEAEGDRVPVFAVGLGSDRIARDREVVSVSAGDRALADSVIDLTATVVSHGFATDPIELRVLENGRPIQVRRVTPPADGSPVREVFQVSPSRETVSLYTVEIAPDPSELVSENNTRRVLVRPPTRPRRLLIVQGAPGYEHSFLLRAWAEDSGLEVDSVVRKGVNERGEDTFYIQAASTAGGALASGFPVTRAALFAYDALVLANVEGDFFTRDQLETANAFVAERGGGLLVLGARSFISGGLIGTPLEEVLPLELTDRGGVVRASARSGEPNKLVLTPEGETHPVTLIGADSEASRKRWDALPALAATTPLGAPRAGATILALAGATGGSTRPLVAVQRYGKGRSMIFAGEAAWRWRMLVPTSDRTYETFWRQAVRWITASTTGPVTVAVPSGTMPGDAVTLDVIARDGEFRAIRDASVTLRITDPAGESTEIRPELADGATGRYTGEIGAEQAGVYTLHADVRRGDTALGTAEEWLLVGGADLELADPRRNDEVLRRVVDASGGQILTDASLGDLPNLLRARAPDRAPPERRDLWHNPWTFALIVLLLSAEWVTRRRVGMR